MVLQRAVEKDYLAVVALANMAYRGSGESAGWNTEAGLIEGQRLSEAWLRADVAAKPNAELMVYRDEADGPVLGTVWLEPLENDVWYLGLLTVRPDLQDRQLGRGLLAAAESFAKNQGAQRIRMSVIQVREALIAWYERRGYALTGKTQDFPYGDERFGRPLRDDLCFVMLEKVI